MLNISKIVKGYLWRLKNRYPKMTIEQVVEANEKLKKGIEPEKSYASRFTSDEINALFAKAHDEIRQKDKQKRIQMKKKINRLMTKISIIRKNEKKEMEKSIANINRLYGKALKKIDEDKE